MAAMKRAPPPSCGLGHSPSQQRPQNEPSMSVVPLASRTIQPRSSSAATEAAARIKAGSPIFLGPIVTNTGEVISQTTMELYDPRLWAMDYLLDGVEGSTI